jgi:MarR family 2-MHQ and catechol resistance regulon transcriptional repressor
VTSFSPEYGCDGPGSGGDDPITLAGLVFETSAGLRREVGPTLERDYGLPTQSFGVLIRLARSPCQRLRMSDLASQTALTPSGLTRAVDRLVEAGLVERAACPEDRRGQFALLTSLGSKTMAAALECHRSRLEELFADLFDTSERRELVHLLGRLRDRVAPEAAQITLGPDS